MGYKEILNKYKNYAFVLVSTPRGLLDYNGVLANKQGGEVLFISLYRNILKVNNKMALVRYRLNNKC